MSGDASAGDGERPEPLLRVVRGAPDAATLAALVTVLVAVAGGRGAEGSEPEPPEADPWRDHARRLGAPTSPGPAAWPTSARP